VKAAVYNRFLHSMGGGERHSGMLAQVLAEGGYQVDLIGPEDVGKDVLADHLGLDLGKVNLKIVPDRGEGYLAAVSASYDLFVNASYMSRLRPRAGFNLYLCYFPTPVDHDLSAWRRLLARRLKVRPSAEQRDLTFGLGWFPPEGGRRRSWTWTSEEAFLSLAPGPANTLTMELGRPGAAEPATLVVTDEHDRELARATVRPSGFERVTVDVPAHTGDVMVKLASETFVPGGGDPRHLGVAVSRLRVAGATRGPRERLAERFPWLLRDGDDVGFVGAYDRVLANSEYTRGWIRRFWGVDSDVLFPPIRVHELHPGAKAKRILTVGRMFLPGQGHNKKQLEQVQAFGEMVRRGGLDGWSMHVVGGVEPAQWPYVERIREAAAGLPVHLHTNAPRAEVEELFATSSIFWSATGLGEDEEKAPWNFEHFGITTVEAMAAGCVPVVIDRAGQREIVRHGTDGYRWTSLPELAAHTRTLMADDALRERMSAAAFARAQAFSEQAFSERWLRIAAGLGLPEKV
jgi:glycosyltransferase involved in cell wall biosynthesis